MAMKFLNEDTGIIKDAVFCFTGKSPKTRPEMEAIALKAKGQVTKSVNKNTTILVIADASSMSSKARKARDNHIALISPKRFFKMCSGSPWSVEPLQYNENSKYMDKIIDKTNKPNPVSRHSSIRRIEL